MRGFVAVVEGGDDGGEDGRVDGGWGEVVVVGVDGCRDGVSVVSVGIGFSVGVGGGVWWRGFGRRRGGL